MGFAKGQLNVPITSSMHSLREGITCVRITCLFDIMLNEILPVPNMLA